MGTWQWAPDGKRIYFVGPETADADEKARREKKFTVDIRNAETPLASLWAVDLEPRKVTAADARRAQSRSPTSPSREDGKWVGLPRNRRRPLQAQHHRAEHQQRPVPARGSDRPGRAADEQQRGRRKRPQLLPGRPLDGVLRAGRPDEVQHEERPRVPSRGGGPRGQVAQARRVVRRRRHRRLLVEGRQHHLLQRRRIAPRLSSSRSTCRRTPSDR